MDQLEIRVRYLEKIMSKFLSKRMDNESKNKIEDGGQNPPSPPPADQGDDFNAPKLTPAFQLSAKAFDVKSPKTGKMITVTQEILEKDPELLAWMQSKHPDCFITSNE